MQKYIAKLFDQSTVCPRLHVKHSFHIGKLKQNLIAVMMIVMLRT